MIERKSRNSLSVIIPAFNEEADLKETVADVLWALREAGFSDNNREIFIFDDFSSDNTAKIADEAAKTDKSIIVVHNSQNMGLGYNYRKGVEMAAKKYVTMIAADTEFSRTSLKFLFSLTGKGDIISSYVENDARSRFRRFVSAVFVRMINFLFGLKMRYYNGICIFKTDLVRGALPRTYGFAYMAEILVRLRKSGCECVEVPLRMERRLSGRSNAFRLKNVLSVFKTIILLFWEVRVLGRKIN